MFAFSIANSKAASEISTASTLLSGNNFFNIKAIHPEPVPMSKNLFGLLIFSLII